ncbi:hypothetical protein SAMN05192529_10367 [Arachidicoccus rhizosphaerae]|jgi:hypothetical protein|uniref:Uncharacterized protein n=1 Tax=Arachidicoccus rhizosphaerae TaxID=551991 RepID=A0A1H3WJG0_9BACT|nr:hypothetical protein SAMN05192529_10367 [Arachidicoccus rhizosphaerae]
MRQDSSSKIRNSAKFVGYSVHARTLEGTQIMQSTSKIFALNEYKALLNKSHN